MAALAWLTAHVALSLAVRALKADAKADANFGAPVDANADRIVWSLASAMAIGVGLAGIEIIHLMAIQPFGSRAFPPSMPGIESMIRPVIGASICFVTVRWFAGLVSGAVSRVFRRLPAGVTRVLVAVCVGLVLLLPIALDLQAGAGATGQSGWLAAGLTLLICVVLGMMLRLSSVASAAPAVPDPGSPTAPLTRTLAEANAELARLSTRDMLTGLANRHQLTESIRLAINASGASDRGFALLHIALDRFTQVNASMGPDVGDEMLRLYARRIVEELRPSDFVARIGGDEFGVILRNLSDAHRIEIVTSRLLEAVATPIMVGKMTMHMTASIGIAVFPADGDSAGPLLANAVAAANAAKAAGRAQFSFFTAEMSRASRMRLELENDLRMAVARNELELHYQPTVSLTNVRVLGMEALVRWRHPTRGLVAPMDFIPIAEETSQIVPIGEWVLREACRQVQAWNREGLSRLKVAVNISAVQFGQADIAAVVASALHDSGLPPSQLTIELTESTVMSKAEKAIDILVELATMGVSIAIDDFGTGYSSLSYLRRFPLNTLKIDRSFVKDVNRDPDAAAIVQSVVSLAHSLRLGVVAEGIEDVGQKEFLASLGCDSAQGFLFSKPLPADEFRAFVLAKRDEAIARAEFGADAEVVEAVDTVEAPDLPAGSGLSSRG